jgi:hypothetical protein
MRRPCTNARKNTAPELVHPGATRTSHLQFVSPRIPAFGRLWKQLKPTNNSVIITDIMITASSPPPAD